MRSQKERKIFFIKGFLLVMAGVAVSELLLSFVYNTWVYPFLRSNLEWELFTLENTSGSALYNIFSMTAWFLAQGLLAVLPEFISIPMRTFAGKYIKSSMRISINEYFAGFPDMVLFLYCIGCLLILLLLLVVLLLPYMIGAWCYSRIINRELNRILEEENEQHLEYEKRRSLMLSDIAHDLKTPITTISGYAQALQEGMVEDRQRQQEYLDAICRKSRQMDNLIQLLYEYVKLDSSGFELKKKDLDICELLRENVAAAYPDMEEKEITLDMDIPEQKVVYPVDRVEFSRAVANLIGNALRHNPPGIHLLVRMEPVASGSRWRILVGDTGRAIAPEVAAHIFEPFVMGDESRNSRGGSGLGTSIAYKIIKMHGWELALSERPTAEYTKAFVITLDEPLSKGK